MSRTPEHFSLIPAQAVASLSVSQFAIKLSPHPEELADALAEAGVSEDGGKCAVPATDLGFTEIRIIRCASRQHPTCVVLRDAMR
jgi:hypothetical protein